MDTESKIREFDLNIEKVLENWDVSHAVREIIANAIDEQTITNTKDIEISKDEDGNWHIRDYGRGLQYIHLTQNENEEKLNHPNLIGKFGVGLKDALATFDRHGIKVSIDSKYGHITIGHSVKHGFSDITTLHAYISEPLTKDCIGTEFILSGCTYTDIEAAKSCFLKFTKPMLLEKTEYGEIFENRHSSAEIYVNGIKVADEENFLFSYNITSLNVALRKSLNRERTNVGRAAYSDRVRTILLNAKSEQVINKLTDNLTKMSYGTQKDELKWIDVQTHAAKLLHSSEETVFVTPEEVEQSSGSVMEIIHNSGKTPIFVPSTVKNKIEGTKDTHGNQMSTISTVVETYNKSFEYEYIPYEKLTEQEKQIFDLAKPTIEMIGSHVKPEQVFISEKLRPDIDFYEAGVFDPSKRIIVIKRSQLANAESFLGTLVHELIHADTGYSDINRYFETALTKKIGFFAAKVIKNKPLTKTKIIEKAVETNPKVIESNKKRGLFSRFSNNKQ